MKVFNIPKKGRNYKGEIQKEKENSFTKSFFEKGFGVGSFLGYTPVN